MLIPLLFVGSGLFAVLFSAKKPEAPAPPPSKTIGAAAGPLPEFADIVDPLDAFTPGK